MTLVSLCPLIIGHYQMAMAVKAFTACKMQADQHVQGARRPSWLKAKWY